MGRKLALSRYRASWSARTVQAEHVAALDERLPLIGVAAVTTLKDAFSKTERTPHSPTETDERDPPS